MNAIDRTAMLKEFDALKQAQSTHQCAEMMGLKSAVYTDPAHFERERDILLRGMPSVAATSGMIPDEGCAVDVRVGGVPIVLLRDESGQAQGFVNACRHRGSPLVNEPCRPGKSLRCPFHSWTYGLDGVLKATPGDCGGFDGLSHDAFSLKRVPVLEENGLIHVLPAGVDSVDSLEWSMPKGFVADELAHFDLAGHRIYKRRTDRFRTNWKLILDTFTETYHIFSLHKDSIHPVYRTAPSLCETEGPVSRSVTFKYSLDRLRDKGVAEDDIALEEHAIWAYLFAPNCVLTHPLDHFELWHVDPVSVDECDVTMTMLVKDDGRDPEEQERDWALSWDLVCSVVHVEDFLNQEKIYAGLTNPHTDRVVFGRNEPALIHFHTTLLDKLGLSEEMKFTP